MNTHKYPCSLFIFTLFLLSTTPLFGSGQPTLGDYDIGKQFFLSAKYQQARKHLYKAFRQDPVNPDINFHLGRAAFELGDYETALLAFERVLFIDPDASRIKLEIARCHLRLGFKEMAKQYFREVLATKPPEPVWRNIEKYLAAIEQQEKRHLFTGTLTMGINFDDNVYLAPASDILSLGTGEIVLTGDSAISQDDTVLTTTALLNHIYRFDEPTVTWKSTFTNYNAFYESYHDLDINYYSLTSGPVWKTDHFMWNNYAIAKHIDVEYERYLNAFGFGTLLTLPFSQQGLVSFGARFEDKENHPYPSRDAGNLSLNVNPVFTIGPNRLSVLFFKEKENADAHVYSYDRTGWLLHYERVFPWGLSAFAGIGYQQTDYDAADPLFLVARSDTVQELKGGISKLLWQSETTRTNLSAQLAYTYLDSDSNMDLYTYRKNLATFSLTVGFF